MRNITIATLDRKSRHPEEHKIGVRIHSLILGEIVMHKSRTSAWIFCSKKNIPSAKLQEHVKNHANNKIATWTNNFHYPCPRRHHYCEFCEKEFSNVDHTLFDQHMDTHIS